MGLLNKVFNKPEPKAKPPLLIGMVYTNLVFE